ncbi:hypothetical protein [Methylobacterium gnaphalii]|uniref:Glycine-rich domain-containing protein n=1 Tax=Methylobacterium gnaphalii TaxID=1010610 RepID=A0A512JIL2_9HYPH|nr:hypothetical protein [Methylobacterium gnaphalii]GEP09799.1 hypothetical protein MGN01_16440 [Methylobacterium gnaphalii]GJD67286.1 hypothetical protein MMMDOFMJ_0200 [Methylobacterium gnaphalii]GLS49829.1 hypothetical protein GCM10007885_26810 [Methylobacterium gnaphalii]
MPERKPLLYNQPYDQTNPNAPYVDGNPSAGISGSIPRAAAIEFPQREIVGAITLAGLQPSNDDLTQLWQAMQKAAAAVAPQQSLVHAGTDTGSANQIVVDVTPSITTLVDGTIIEVAPAATNTGAATLNADGIGVRPIVRADGSALQPGDLQVGSKRLFAWDAASGKYQIIGLYSSYSPPRNLQSFAVSGSYTFTVPLGVYWIFCECVGAGGGGGGGAGSATWASGGGGSGGYAAGWVSVTPGQVINLIVGAKGAGGSNGNAEQAGTGGTTSIGSFMQATGGSGGTGGNLGAPGGTPGVGSGGQRNLYGSNGGDGNPYRSDSQGGQGAASAFGGGGRTATKNTGGVLDGVAPGSGGGGIWYTGPVQQGGTGADGAIYIQY